MNFWEKIKTNVQSFIIGLLIGLIVGGGFFIFKLESYFKELLFVKEQFKVESLFSSKKESDNLSQSLPNKKNYSKSTTSANKILKDSTINNKTSVSNISDSLTKSVDSLANSPSQSIIADDVVVRSDELLGTQKLEVVNFNSDIDLTATQKDTLLEQLSGIKATKEQSTYKVELWQSPINYKGYKMSKGSIVVYGIDPNQTIKLFKVDNAILMKLQTVVYKLSYTNIFKPLEKIENEEVLAKLN